jgi:hypothetical protein
MRIAFAAPAAGGEHNTVAGLIQIADSLAGPGVANDSSHRNFNDEILAAAAMTIAAHSVLAATGLALFVIAEIQQCRELCIRNRDDIATGPAIATVGSAAANELLTMKADATTSAIAANDPYFCLIDEFHDLIIREPQVRPRLTDHLATTSHLLYLFSTHCTIA